MTRDEVGMAARALTASWEPVGAIPFPDEVQDAAIASAASKATRTRLCESEPEQRAPAATRGGP